MNLQERINGKLPEIDIAGTMFYVDLRMRELRADYTLNSHIHLDALSSDLMASGYRFAFNTVTKKLVEIDAGITEWPANVVIIEIPDELTLDPVAVARHAGLDPVEFIKQHPIEPELKARIVPLETTAFPKLIEENKKKLSQKIIQRPQQLRQRPNRNRLQ